MVDTIISKVAFLFFFLSHFISAIFLKKIACFLGVLDLLCCTWAFDSCGERGLHSSRAAQASCCGFSCWGAQALERAGFSSCGTQA